MKCALRFVVHISSLVRFCLFLCMLGIMSILPIRECNALERFPRLALDEEAGAGWFADTPPSVTDASVGKQPHSYAGPLSALPKPLAQQTTEIQIERLKPSGPRFRVMLTTGAGYGAEKHGLKWFESGRASGGVGGGTLRFACSNEFYLGFSYRRQKLDVEDWLKVERDQAGNITTNPLNWNISLDEMLFVIGWTSSPATDKSLITYADVGAGAIRWVESATRSDGSKYTAADRDETMFALMLLTAGGIIPLSREIGLNLEADWITTMRGQWENLFGFRIGMAIMLGGD